VVVVEQRGQTADVRGDATGLPPVTIGSASHGRGREPELPAHALVGGDHVPDVDGDRLSGGGRGQ